MLKGFFKKLNGGLVRFNNISVWGPMVFSVLIMFASPVVSALFVGNQSVFWICAACSFIFSALFVVLSAKYVKQWHSINSVLRTNMSLLNTCGFLASMSRSKLKNDRITFDDMVVEYTFSDPKEINNRIYFPFHTSYRLNGVVNSRKGIQNFYSRFVSHSSNKMKDNIHASTIDSRGCHMDADIRLIRNSHTLSEYEISFSRLIGFEEHISIIIDIDFLETHGVSSEGLQRLLFYPSNFSTRFEDNAKANIKFILTGQAKDQMSNIFENVYIHRYINGLNEDPATADSPLTLTSKSMGETVVYEQSVDLSENVLYAIVFRRKE